VWTKDYVLKPENYMPFLVLVLVLGVAGGPILPLAWEACRWTERKRDKEHEAAAMKITLGMGSGAVPLGACGVAHRCSSRRMHTVPKGRALPGEKVDRAPRPMVGPSGAAAPTIGGLPQAAISLDI
jgi:hypothetical protein